MTSIRRLVAVAAATALLATGCGGTTHTSGAPVLTVVTGLWPLAVAARAIGLGNVKVLDPVPAGVDPRSWTPGSGEQAAIAGADVVLVAGGGFEPGLETAAASNPHTVDLVASSDPAQTEVWLNPFLMEGVGQRIASVLERLDPRAAPTFRTGLADWLSELSAVDASYQSTLSVCTAHRLVAVDPAMGVLAARYDLTVTPLLDTVAPVALPSSAMVAHEAAIIRGARTNRVYGDDSVPVSFVVAALAASDAHVAGTFLSLLGPPSGDHATYPEQLSANLSVLSKALSCPDDSTS